MRKHRPVFPKREQATPVRPGWTLAVVHDPKEIEHETYRYWQSRTAGERLAGVWEATEAAYSIRTVE